MSNSDHNNVPPLPPSPPPILSKPNNTSVKNVRIISTVF